MHVSAHAQVRLGKTGPRPLSGARVGCRRRNLGSDTDQVTHTTRTEKGVDGQPSGGARVETAAAPTK
jgi:hypothetical protein